MKANFKKINVEVEFDKYQELDITKELGNYIHTNTPDIGMDDVAREIYYSEGEVDIPDEYVPTIIELIKLNRCLFLAGVKRAIIKMLEG